MAKQKLLHHAQHEIQVAAENFVQFLGTSVGE